MGIRTREVVRLVSFAALGALGSFGGLGSFGALGTRGFLGGFGLRRRPPRGMPPCRQSAQGIRWDDWGCGKFDTWEHWVRIQNNKPSRDADSLFSGGGWGGGRGDLIVRQHLRRLSETAL